jgi:hypothetical protein
LCALAVAAAMTLPVRGNAFVPVIAARAAVANAAATAALATAAVAHGAAAHALAGAAVLHAAPVPLGFAYGGVSAVRGLHLGGAGFLTAGAAGVESGLALTGTAIALVGGGVALFPAPGIPLPIRIGAAGVAVHGAAVAGHAGIAAPVHLHIAGTELHLAAASGMGTVASAAVATTHAGITGFTMSAAAWEATLARFAAHAAVVSILLPPPIL